MLLRQHADFLLFVSIFKGHLKFWKKTAVGIEFAKHFRSHLNAIEGLAVSSFSFVKVSLEFYFSIDPSLISLICQSYQILYSI